MFLVFAIIATILTRLSDLSTVVKNDPKDCRAAFCVTGTVSYVIGYHENIHHILLEGDGVGVDIHGRTENPPRTGDVIRIEGHFEPRGAGSVQPEFHSFRILGHEDAPLPAQGTATEIMSGKHDFKRACLVGEVRDVEPSGTDPCWNYISIISRGNQHYAPIPSRGASLSQLESLIGATVILDGFPDPHNCSFRFLDERRFMVADLAHIRTLQAPSDDPFLLAPPIDALHRLSTEKISRLGRHRASGLVLTIWQNHHALIQLDDGRKAVITFSGPPGISRGQTIEVIGYPSTDGFMLNLNRAIARPVAGATFIEPKVSTLSHEDIENWLSNAFRDKRQLQGVRIRLCGTIAEFGAHVRERGLLSLSIAGHILDVDVSALPTGTRSLVPGCYVRVTGTCVLATENWSAISKGVRLNGIQLVLDHENDIEILSFPPWWTPTRLSIMIGVLLLFLIGCLAWNRLLHRLSEKRGQELFNERTANALAELKAEERTRLAIELHDSISQTLTGAAMQLDAGETGAAKRILASCRRELRSCLWDLRSHAMDAANFADAIRETIEPHLGGRQASVDFDLPASSLSEDLRRTALRIIREATVNAVRHGRASLIAISGEMSGRRMSISIVDNGRGFNPSVSQGSATGHFGLLGMRERAKAFNGFLDIASKPGNGTEVSVVLEERAEYDLDDNATSRK